MRVSASAVAPLTSTVARRASKQQQLRQLHITLPAPNPAPWLGADLRNHRYAPQTFTDLQNECQRRRLSISGSKTELVDRLTNADLSQKKAFVTASGVANRPVVPQSIPAPPRQFSQTSARTAPTASSTIDHFYLPRPAAASTRDMPYRLPLLPTATTSHPSHAEEEPVFRTEITTVADESTHVHGAPSAMSDVVDNAAVEVDVFDLAGKVGRAARGRVEEEAGELGKVWRGFIGDLIGEHGHGKSF
ncbi:MAG: hypothetical protein M1825_006316 [Sarcosagium campestre]|nr:MAG: hypothetical protein M1825_006316 [Sarcosagium campestre]